MTTLPVSGVWCPLGIGAGSGIKHDTTTVRMTQSRLLGANPVVSLCDQEPVETFQKVPRAEKAKLKVRRTYLSHFRLTVHHIQGRKKEMADYISRNNFHAFLGQSSEALAKETFQRMDVQLHLFMCTAV